MPHGARPGNGRYVDETGALDAGITGHDWVVETVRSVRIVRINLCQNNVCACPLGPAVPEIPAIKRGGLEGK